MRFPFPRRAGRVCDVCNVRISFVMNKKLLKKISKAIKLYGDDPNPGKLTAALSKIADEQYKEDRKREAN